MYAISGGDSSKAAEYQAPAEATKLAVNQQHLKQAWDVSQVATKEEWLDWIQRLSVEFMRESPSHALRACMSLVDVHQPLARELFNAAFVSCWGELYDQYQVRFTSFHLVVAPANIRAHSHTGGSRSLHRVRDHLQYSPLRAGPPTAQSG